jgi:DNA polymerase-3 subunit gamma/tau
MSLLAQVLALGQGCITAEQVREVLGLASQETMFALFEALRDQDCVGINTVLRKVTDQGLDLAFFLRELSSTWRNLFLLKQAGDKAFELLDLSSEEARQWTKWAESFSAAHIHACWQMTLEGQRRVLTSVEPVLALELLALNLAFLPDLLPVGQLSRPKTGSGPGPGGSGPHPASGDRPEPTDQAPQSEEADGTPGAESKTWAGFVRFCRQKAEGGEKVALEVSRLEGEVLGQVLWLKCPSEVQSQLLAGPEKKSSLQVLASQYFETSMQIEVCGPGSSAEQGQDGLKEEALRHPAIQEAFSSFQAQLVNVVARTNRQVT